MIHASVLTGIFAALKSPLYAACATAGFSFLFGMRRTDAVLAAAGGAIGLSVSLVMTSMGASTALAMFVASLIVSFWSEAISRFRRRPATVYMITGVIPLVPGGGMYYTMLASIDGNTWKSVEMGLATIITAFAIAAGLATGSSAGILLEPARRFHRQRLRDLLR